MNRILIVKLAALGDAVMASTLVPAIRARWPNAQISWAAGSGVAPLVRCMEGVDRVIEINDQALLGGNKAVAVATMVGSWLRIGRGYDLALIAHTDPRYAVIAQFSGAKDIRRFADERAPRPGRWHGSEYLRLLDDASANTRTPALAALRANALIASSLDGRAVDRGSGALIVVAPGGGRNILHDDPLRRWPIASWVAVVAALVAQGHRVVATGSQTDWEECAACARAGATDMSGKTNLLEALALIKAADVVVTADSGSLHLATLLNRPTVALFGPTRPDERIPAGAPVTVLSRAAELTCAPCYDGFRYAECALNLCLARVAIQEVVTAVNDRLSNAGPYEPPTPSPQTP